MNEELLSALRKYLSNGDYKNAYDCVVHIYEEAEDKRQARKMVVAFRQSLKEVISQNYDVSDNYELLHSAYLLCAKESFDDFMVALEWYRPVEERFWTVRREQLLPVCTQLEALANDEVDELFLSMPPRVGKSTIVMFFLIWWMCKHPELPNLYSSYTEKVVKTFFNGVLEVFTDPVTYDLYSVFPNAKIASTDSKDLLLNIKRKKRYPNLTARSVDGSLNGSADVNGGILIADDLHSGIDEARSKDQMINKWSTVQNNLLSRKANKILWIGTHWSIIDCISNRIELLETSDEAKHIRYKVFNVPALNDKEESNFDYMFHKGFTTDDYKAIRASFLLKDDQASWLAQYMGTPIERDGAVFSPSELRYYNGELPKEMVDGEMVNIQPDRIFMCVDPAWGGGDYVAAPLVYQYGDDLYIHDVVYDNGDKTVTEPKIVQMAKHHEVAAMYVEATLTTKGYMDELDERFRREGYRLNIQRTTKHWTGTGKAQRIFDKAPEIRERMVFLDVPHRSKEYTMFMQNVFAFTVEGKNKHDDAPDSLAMVIALTRSTPTKVVVMQRKF